MDENGFSLLEIVVALTIIAIAILPMLLVLGQEKRYDREIELKNLALEIAKSEVLWAREKELLPESKEINLGGRNFVIIYEIDDSDLNISVREKGGEKLLVSLTSRR